MIDDTTQSSGPQTDASAKKFYPYLPDDPAGRRWCESRLVTVSLTLEHWAFVNAILMQAFTSPEIADEPCGPSEEIERCCYEKFPVIAESVFKQCRKDLSGRRSLRLRETLRYLLRQDYCLFHDLAQLAQEHLFGGRGLSLGS